MSLIDLLSTLKKANTIKAPSSMKMENMNCTRMSPMSPSSMKMENMNCTRMSSMAPSSVIMENMKMSSMDMDNMNHENHMKISLMSPSPMKMENINKTMCPPGGFNDNEDCDCGPERIKSNIDNGLSICLMPKEDN